MDINDNLDEAFGHFEKVAKNSKENKKMKKAEYETMYAIYFVKLRSLYEEGVITIKDGFQFNDIEVLKDLILNVYAVLMEIDEQLSVTDVKDFLTYFIMSLYDVYHAKLPWYVRLFPFKAYFVKRTVAKYVGKLVDYLQKKGLIN